MPEPRMPIPDPVALARGHRLSRAARLLEIPAWVCGSLVLLIGCGLCFIEDEPVVLVVLSLLALAVLWSLSGRARSFAIPTATDRNSHLPRDLHDLLTVVECLISALERGDDRSFDLELGELGRALDGLGPDALCHLDERGADHARLRRGVCTYDPDARLGSSLSAERRRSLHHELHRFAAAARVRPSADPYRSHRSAGPSLDLTNRERALAHVRRRLWVVTAIVLIAWVAIGHAIASLAIDRQKFECGQFGCGYVLMPLELSTVLIVLVACAPMLGLALAQVCRNAAWRSWVAALPETPAPRTKLGRAARRRRWRRAVARAFAGLPVGLLLVWDLELHELEIGECVVGILFVTLMRAAAIRGWARIERDCERNDANGRSSDAPAAATTLSELFRVRAELQISAPVRGELLDQLADTLAGAKALGRLSPAQRDSTIARLRAAAARDAAVSRDLRDELALEVRCCEDLIAGH